jgi:uncharacterized protein YecT (DUF1311 family)
MTKRDHVAEILAARARGRGHTVAGELRLMSLAYRAKQPGAEGYIEYFPVAAVAALEAVFRGAVRQLVDFGPPYSDRADAVIHDAKVDLTVLRATHGRKISVGDFVAHLVPFKSLDDINKALTTLFGGASLFDAVKIVDDPWAERPRGTSKVLPSHGPVFEDVKALIAARHQLAHEVLETSPVSDLIVLQRQLLHLERFAHAITEVVSQALYPNAPLTQADMNVAASRDAAKADEVMNRAYNASLAEVTGDEREALEASQQAFIGYRQRAVDHAGARVSGGSIRPTVESLEFERLTRHRTEDLLRLQEAWTERDRIDDADPRR